MTLTHIISPTHNAHLSLDVLFSDITAERITPEMVLENLEKASARGEPTVYTRQPQEAVTFDEYTTLVGTLSRDTSHKVRQRAWDKWQSCNDGALFDGDELNPNALFGAINAYYCDRDQPAGTNKPSALSPLASWDRACLSLAVSVADHFGNPSTNPVKPELHNYRVSAFDELEVPLVGAIALAESSKSAFRITMSDAEADKTINTIAGILLRGVDLRGKSPGRYFASRGVVYTPSVAEGQKYSVVAIEPRHFVAGVHAAIARGGFITRNGFSQPMQSFTLRMFTRALDAAANETSTAAAAEIPSAKSARFTDFNESI